VAYCVNKILKEAKKTSKKVPATISDEELVEMNALLSLLKPFAELTDTWQTDGVNSSIVILSLIDALRGKQNLILT